MATYTGFISKIAIKEGRGSRGPWKLYSGRVEKEDGVEYDDWISFGFDKPNVKEGDYVKIETQADAKGYQKVQSIEILKNPPKAPASSQAAPSSTNSNVRQDSIIYQSSRKDAIAVLELLVSQDALPLTRAKEKAGQAKRYEEIMALVDKLTVRYFNDVASLRILDTVADEGANDDTIESHEPVSEEDDA